MIRRLYRLWLKWRLRKQGCNPEAWALLEELWDAEDRMDKLGPWTKKTTASE